MVAGRAPANQRPSFGSNCLERSWLRLPVGVLRAAPDSPSHFVEQLEAPTMSSHGIFFKANLFTVTNQVERHFTATIEHSCCLVFPISFHSFWWQLVGRLCFVAVGSAH